MKTVVLGSLSGALIMSALSAFVWWILFYTDTRSGIFVGRHQDWASVAAIVGGVIGFVAGAVLGVALSVLRRGSVFGTLAGAIAGLAIFVMILARAGLTTGDPRLDLVFWAFVPIGATAGFLTSLIVSAIASSAKPSEHTYTVLGLQQKKSDESL